MSKIYIFTGIHTEYPSAAYIKSFIKYFKKHEINIISFEEALKRISRFSFSSMLLTTLIRLEGRIVSFCQNLLFRSKYLFELPRPLSFYLILSPFLKSIEPGSVLVITFTHGIRYFQKIEQILVRKNVFLMYHPVDMALITGGCHFSMGCSGYKKGCNNCPALNTSWINFFRSPFSSSAHVLSRGQLYEQIISSGIFDKKKIRKSFLPIDIELFKNLQDVIPIYDILILSSRGTECRKGLWLFDKMWNDPYCSEMRNLKVRIIGVDSKYDNYSNVLCSKNVKYEDLCLIYNQSNIFLSLSIEDSGPLTVMQALCCGTKVVATNVGIVRDQLLSKGVWACEVDHRAIYENILLARSEKFDKLELSQHYQSLIQKDIDGFFSSVI